MESDPNFDLFLQTFRQKFHSVLISWKLHWNMVPVGGGEVLIWSRLATFKVHIFIIAFLQILK